MRLDERKGGDGIMNLVLHAESLSDSRECRSDTLYLTLRTITDVIEKLSVLTALREASEKRGKGLKGRTFYGGETRYALMDPCFSWTEKEKAEVWGWRTEIGITITEETKKVRTINSRGNPINSSVPFSPDSSTVKTMGSILLERL